MTQPLDRQRTATIPVEAVGWPAVPEQVPATMAATVFASFGGPEVLVPTEMEVPALGDADVLVRVGAVSVGRLLDLSSRAGTHPFAGFRLPHVLGAEHAGTVVQVGSRASGIAVGDAVAVYPSITCGDCELCVAGRTDACARLQIVGVHRQGAYAEYSAVPATNVRVLSGTTRAATNPVIAAALALSGPVSMHQLRQAGMKPGDWVLVQGAASALGSVTAALAVHLGARVIGTSRSAAKRAVLHDLGLQAALDSRDGELVAQVMALTHGRGVAVVVDDLGDREIFATSAACLGVLGTIVTSGAFLGGQVELDLARLYLRSQRVIGVRTGTHDAIEALWREVDAGFRPLVDVAFPLERAADAHRYLAGDTGTGRVVLVPPGGQDGLEGTASDPGSPTCPPPVVGPTASEVRRTRRRGAARCWGQVRAD